MHSAQTAPRVSPGHRNAGNALFLQPVFCPAHHPVAVALVKRIWTAGPQQRRHGAATVGPYTLETSAKNPTLVQWSVSIDIMAAHLAKACATRPPNANTGYGKAAPGKYFLKE